MVIKVEMLLKAITKMPLKIAHVVLERYYSVNNELNSCSQLSVIFSRLVSSVAAPEVAVT